MINRKDKTMAPEDEPPKSEGVPYAMREQHRAATESSGENAAAGRGRNDA